MVDDDALGELGLLLAGLALLDGELAVVGLAPDHGGVGQERRDLLVGRVLPALEFHVPGSVLGAARDVHRGVLFTKSLNLSMACLTTIASFGVPHFPFVLNCTTGRFATSISVFSASSFA